MLEPFQAPPAWLWLLLVGLLALLWRLAATRIRRGNARRGAAARRAEARAERLLARHGYRVVERQVTATFDVAIDGAPLEVWCRADLIVTRRRRRWVAEVKSSGAHTDPTHPSTRRQLLEYRLAFDVDGVLLVDMARREVHEITFPLLSRAWPRGKVLVG